MTYKDDLDERFDRIARATAPVGPSAGFRGRMQRALEAEREADLRRAFVRAGRLTLAAAAVLALGAVAFAVERSQAADEVTAAGYGIEEDFGW